MQVKSNDILLILPMRYINLLCDWAGFVQSMARPMCEYLKRGRGAG